MSTIPPPPPIGGPRDENPHSPTPTPPDLPSVSETPPAGSPPPLVETPPPPPPPVPQINPTIHPQADLSNGAVATPKKNSGVISLILGILGFCGITAIVGLVFGIMAFNESKKNEGKGKALAVTGIVLNALWLGLFLLVMIFGGSE